MEARISRFAQRGNCASNRHSPARHRRALDGPETGMTSGIQQELSSTGDNRFMPGITLHYPEFSGMGVTPANAT